MSKFISNMMLWYSEYYNRILDEMQCVKRISMTKMINFVIWLEFFQVNFIKCAVMYGKRGGHVAYAKFYYASWINSSYTTTFEDFVE